jgi:hypothetical protein
VSDPRLSLGTKVFRLDSAGRDDDRGFEIRFLENVLAHDPCNEDALMVLGHAYTRRGEFERGLDIDRRLTRLRPADPTAFYNLACSHALLGDVPSAYTALEKAFTLGYADLGHVLKDPDLETLRRDRGFRRFINEIAAAHCGDC